MISGLKVETAMRPLPAAMAFAVAVLVALPVSTLAQVRANAQAPLVAPRPREQPSATLEPGRYLSESREAFIFDIRDGRPLFRFERREETWVLRPSPAPRGDVIYRNDAGSQILRVTPNGGVTLYTTAAPNGSPASRVGPGTPLTLPELGPVRLFTLMNQRGSLVSRALGRLVVINLSGERSEALMVDALVVSTEAVIRMARSPTFRDQLNGLRSITLVEGDRASVSFSRGDLRIVVDPDEGQAGRPSSARIIRAVSSGG